MEIGLLDGDGVFMVDDIIFKFGFDWKVNENVLFFVNYLEGFCLLVINRLGGDVVVNDIGVFVDFCVLVYLIIDMLDNYEIGLKGDFLDGILCVNVIGYYLEISDL